MEDTEDQIANRWIPLILILATVGSILFATFYESNNLAKFLPLFVVFVSIGSQILRDILKEKKEHKHKKEFLKEMIIGFNEGIKSQIRDIDSILPKITEKKMNNYFLTISIRINKINIDVISRLDAYKFLIKKSNVKNSAFQFQDLYTHIDLAVGLLKDLEGTFGKSNEELQKYIEEWYIQADKVRLYYDNLAHRLNGLSTSESEIQSHPFLSEFFNIYQTWAKDPEKNNIYILYDQLITPLRGIKKEYSELELTNYLLSCDAAFQNYESCKQLFVKKLEYTKSEFKTCQEKIDEYLEKMF